MISFIIPAYNEEQLLGRTLTALTAAARALGQPFEVVVVDDASTDRTATVVREHGARVVQVNHRQIAATRNAGAKATTGEMLIFVDADTVVTEAAVRAAVAAMRAGAVGGGCAFRFDGRLPLYGRIMQTVAVPLYRMLALASGCFLFCTREAFHSVGGFDEALFGAEEAAMSRALRRQGRFIILRESVTTSGRKLRAYSAREILGLLARLALSGPKSVRRREGLDIWYGERRMDPETGNRFVPDEIDLEKWGAASRARMDRKLPDGCKLDLNGSSPSFGKPTTVTIAADPPGFADRPCRESDVCPVCGESTSNRTRIGAMLDVQYECGFGCFIGAWAHPACLERCPVIGKAVHVPW